MKKSFASRPIRAARQNDTIQCKRQNGLSLVVLKRNKGHGKKARKNAIFSVIALIAIFVVNFFLPRLMPGDPLDNLIGAEESVLTHEQYAELYSKWG